MRLSPLSFVAGLALALGAASALAQKTQLLVYTALETDQLKAYQEGFNKVHPDIDIKWVRDSTGVITAKLLAEKANPQADAVMGVAASSLALLDKNGMLEPYKPLNLDAIMSAYRDKKNPPAWFGMDVWGATVCFNTVEAAKRNIPKPETWKDLTKPAYKGQIVMPNPASSGTGFFDVTAWLTLWGDDNGKGGGWKYMDALHENIAQYTHSGSKPCNMAASGEFVVGISFEYRANANKAKGAPIDLVFPKEGLGLGPGGLCDPQGHQEARRGEEAGRLGQQQGRDAAVRQELRHHRAARRGRPAGQRAQGLRGPAGEDGLQRGRRQPRARAGGVDEAVQRQIRKTLTPPKRPSGRLPPGGNASGPAEPVPRRLLVWN